MTKLLIGSDLIKKTSGFDKYLEKNNLTCCECIKHGADVCDSIKTEKPDIVIIDLFMPELDAIGIMRTVREAAEKGNDKLPLFAVCSTYSTPLLEREILNEGASFFFISPTDGIEIVRSILEYKKVHLNTHSAEPDLLYARVTTTLHKLGVPSHVKGFQYLRESIIIVCHEPYMLNAITKKLYPRVAEMYNVSSSRVERAMRNAIELTWERCDPHTLDEVFSDKVKYSKGRPTNGEFIAVLSDKIKISFISA